MMDTDEMIDNIKGTVMEICARCPSLKSGYDYWSHHIEIVLKYSILLGEELNADIEILKIASVLHDYAKIASFDENRCTDHHIVGSKIAGDILRAYGYPDNKIKAVQQCILSHRGSVVLEKETIEAQILATADAISHFARVDSLFLFAFSYAKMGLEEGISWISGKLERSFEKMMPQGKVLVREKYDSIKKTLSNSL